MDAYTSAVRGYGAQTEKVDDRQVKNAAGGYVFQVSPKERVRRILILGTEGGTYYVGAQELTREAVNDLRSFAAEEPDEFLDLIIEVSLGGLSKKQNALLFAYAVACSGPKAKDALSHFREIIRTGTQLFMFLNYVQEFRGWGRALKRAVASWYEQPPVDNVAYQVVKYRQREGWTHRDVLRKAHPFTFNEKRDALFGWATSGTFSDSLPDIVKAHDKAMQMAGQPDNLAEHIRATGLPWEAVPTDALNNVEVLTALGENMPVGATVRNLRRFAKAGLLQPLGGGLTAAVVERLTDPVAIQKSRIHPMQILAALAAYDPSVLSGPDRWYYPHDSDVDYVVSDRIVDALQKAYILSFGNVEPAGKRTLVGLDVSGSMGIQVASGISAAAACAAMTQIQMVTEPSVLVRGFSTSFIDLGLRSSDSLSDIVRKTSGLHFGGTDCAQPMVWALQNKVEVDTFVVYTDNETWAGRTHVHTALKDYRRKTGIPAKLIVVGTSATAASVADPSDAGMLDVVGFSPDVPSAIANFSRE